MRIIDLTRLIDSDMPVFPIYPKPKVFTWTTVETHGFSANALFMVEHTGTHVDAPYHFIKDGQTVDGLKMERFYGRAVVLDLTMFGVKGMIKAEDIRNAEKKPRDEISNTDIVLIRTDWDKHWNKADYATSNPGLSADAAEYLNEKHAKLVGIDSPNIDHPNSESFPVHNTLLSNGTPIIENLTNLERIGKGRFEFVAMPLKIRGGTGSPVRAVAIVK